jgi:hypothetical protein
MNGPCVQVHRREGKRRSPDPGDLRAIYGRHPGRVPATAGPGGPIVRRDLAAAPDRAARRRVTIISAPAGVPPEALEEFRAAGCLHPQLARSGAGLACWHQRAFSGSTGMSTAAWPRTRCSARRPCSSTALFIAVAMTRPPCWPRWPHEPPRPLGRGCHGERWWPVGGGSRSGVSFRSSSRSRPRASIWARTPYSADRSSRPVSTVCTSWCCGPVPGTRTAWWRRGAR